MEIADYLGIAIAVVGERVGLMEIGERRGDSRLFRDCNCCCRRESRVNGDRREERR